MKLKIQRLLKGWSRKDLENHSGVSAKAIQRYEIGELNLKKAAYETVIKLSDALDCEPKDLVD